MSLPNERHSFSDELSWRYPGWLVTFASALGAMVGFRFILIYSFSILLKPLSIAFGWPRETVAAAFACASFTLGICSPGLGFLLDRFGPRRVILPCAAVFGSAFASLALLTHSRLQLFRYVHSHRRSRERDRANGLCEAGIDMVQ